MPKEKKSIRSYSIETFFLCSGFEIRREGFLWIQLRNWNPGKDLHYNINLLYKHCLAFFLLVETLSSMYFININIA